MKIKNFFLLNDWDIKKFLILILSLQLSLSGLIFLDYIGLNIPVLRELIGFIYLTFIPGLLILRILKLHRLGNIKTVLYSVGLSISFLMITGFIINLIYPVIGIVKPLTFLSLFLTITAILAILAVICYVRDKDFSEMNYIDIKTVPKELILSLTPFLAILGTYLVNYHDNNLLLMILMLVIALIAILVSFDKINKRYYPLLIFTSALSLLYNVELISPYITGWDINVEYYFSNLVSMNSVWVLDEYGIVNSVLSIVLLVPIYCNILNLEVDWVFKIIFPFFYALIPLALYLIYKKQTDYKIAFMACFVFITFYKYYQGYLGRLGIAELFLVLLILLLFEKNEKNLQTSILFIIFASSLAVSHYGLSYIFIFLLISVYLLLLLYNRLKSNKMEKNNIHTITFTFILFFSVFTLAWYIYTSDSSAFKAIVNIVNNIYQTIFTEFFDVSSSQSLELATSTLSSPLHQLSKYIHFILQFFIIIGVLLTLKIRQKFKKEYVAFSLFFFLILVASFFVPYLAISLGTDRLYQIGLIFLSPFSIIGGLFILMKILPLFINLKNGGIRSLSFKVLSFFLVIFFLFNVGFIYECFNDEPLSISLSQQNIDKYGTNLDKSSFYSTLYNERDVISVQWFSNNKNNYMNVYSDYLNQKLLLQSYGMINKKGVLRNGLLLKNSYIYLRSSNILYGILYSEKRVPYEIDNIEPQILESNVIYSNGGSEILFIEKANSRINIESDQK